MSATILPFPARRSPAPAAAPAIAIDAATVRSVVNAALEVCWYTREGLDLPMLALDDIADMARHPALDEQLAADSTEFLTVALGWLTEARDRAHAAAQRRDAGPLLSSPGGEVLRWTELRFAVEDLAEAVDLLRARADGRTPMHMHAPEDDDDDQGDGGVPG